MNFLFGKKQSVQAIAEVLEDGREIYARAMQGPKYNNYSGPEPMLFTVNVGNSVETMKVLQVTIVPDFANPEAAHSLAEIKPKVQHRIILLLSSEEIASLQTVKGKQDLQGRLVKELNRLIDETVDTGVKDVFFTSFIIQ